jgi:hypothetical protein
VILTLALLTNCRDDAAAAPADRPCLGGAARGRDRLPLARHQHDEYQALGLRDRRDVRRISPARSSPRARISFRPESFTFIESAIILAIVVLGGMGSQIGVVIAAIVMIGGTELLRELDWLKHLRRRLRPDAVPHATVRPRHGADHDLEAARSSSRRAADRSYLEKRDLRRSSSRRATEMADDKASGQLLTATPLLEIEHLTMRFGGLVAVNDVSFDVPDAATSPR